MARGRKPLPEGFKKQKLTLSCKAESIEYLNTYCNTRGISISQLLDSVAEDLQAEEKKRIAKAERAAKKAEKAAAAEPVKPTTEKDVQLNGQLNFKSTDMKIGEE